MNDDRTTPEMWQDMFTAAQSLISGPFVIFLIVICVMAVMAARRGL